MDTALLKALAALTAGECSDSEMLGEPEFAAEPGDGLILRGASTTPAVLGVMTAKRVLGFPQKCRDAVNLFLSYCPGF